MWTCSKSAAAEDELANLQSLWNQLRTTEKNLQTVEEELSSTSEHYGHCFDEAVDCNLEHCGQPNRNHEGFSNSKKSGVNTSCQNCQRKHKFYSECTTSDKTVEENKHLKEKLETLHEQNTSLASQNHYLKARVETMDFELAQSKIRISYLESTLGTHLVSIPKLKEQIVSLEAEVSARDEILRNAEDKLEQSRKTGMERENMLQRYKKDYKNLKMELIEQSKQGKRAEQQRNEALLNAEELTRAFEKYKEKITEKLEKLETEEIVLGKRVMNCEKEKEKLNDKCISYRKALDILEAQLRQLKEENHSTKEKIKTLETKNTEMVSVLTRSDQKIVELESKLSESETILTEKNALVSENADLRTLTAQQQTHLKLCHQEIEDLREELNILEAVISQLSLGTSEEFKWHHLKHQLSSSSTKEALFESREPNKPLMADLSIKLARNEAEIQNPCANPTIYSGTEHVSSANEGQENSRLCGVETEPVKLIRSQGERRKYLHLECISQRFEKERQRFRKEIEELHTKLTRADDENSSLKISMAQRDSQFQIIQEDLLKAASKSSSLERQITKKSFQLRALEKQLEEKTIAYSTAAARNTELEQELMEKNRCIHELETAVTEVHEQITSAFEKEKLVHLEQHREREKQMELLQTQLEKKHQQFIEQEKLVSILQQDITHKQHHIESLDGLLMESRQELENENVKKDQGLKMLKSRLTEEAMKVSSLEQKLQKQKAYSEDELRKVEDKLCLAAQEADLSRQKVDELNSKIRQITSELDQCKSELTGMEKEVVQLKRAGEDKAMQINQLDITLEEARSELNEKANKVNDLEDKLRQSETCQREALQKIIELESALQNGHGELKTALTQLQELQDALQTAQSSLEEKHIAIMDLTTELRLNT
ncbi:coiled-coil domain-containing protein 18 isoform X3 [Colius striatus]|uniref:coiled-coil domain-containing protein 18 isoform X3 n=1 Tax=Colius striatus TaxID=57412 RepID=UPI002B1E013C|nr:coiled-coil domain-containing protein 18 isoform X3 [Colius striatus]